MWWLRTSGFVMLLLVASVAATAAETGDKKQPAPVAVVENGGTYVFPTTMEGTELRHDFVIRNTGDAPLVIESVKSG